jgi:hypothetical protein
LYQTLLTDASFFALLLRFDKDLAEQARQDRCPCCGGALHSARYPRKPRGGPIGLGAEYRIRLSFCCELCRKRLTPPSLLFLGRKAFFAVWVLLLPLLRQGPTRQSLDRLAQVFAVSRRTLLRWRRFWQQTVPQSRFWQARQGDFATPVAPGALPSSLVAAFALLEGVRERALAVLRWLSPLSAGGQGGHAF